MDIKLQQREKQSIAALAQLSARVGQLRAKSQKVSQSIETLVKRAESLKSFDMPPFAQFKWSKQGQKLGGSPAELAKVAEAEQRGTRESCLAASNVLQGKKNLEPVLKKIQTLLHLDDDVARKFKDLQSKSQAAEVPSKEAEAMVAGLQA